MKKIFFLSSFILFLNCGSIKQYTFGDNIKITESKMIEGKYESYPLDTKKRSYNSFYGILNNFNGDEKQIPEIESFEIMIIDQQNLDIIFNLADSKIKNSLKYSITDDGFIKISNKVKTSGIPYLIGGMQTKKIEFGVTKNRELIVNGKENDESSILFIPVSFPKENFIYKFKKIQ